MDDQLELPTSIAPRDQEDEGGDSSDEEGVQDWTNIPGIHGLSRAAIPKRGEKEFEPATDGPTALQSHVLNRSRNAMFEALRGSRGASSKTISYAVWHPSIARAQVIVARGTHFSALGHSAVRPTLGSDRESSKTQKRLELMPEEALYLMERGSLFCWRASDLPKIMTVHPSDDMDLGDCDMSYGPPMTMQQAFTEMIGTEGLSLQHYIVYAYLKRLGFTVGRAIAPANTPLYPLPLPNNLTISCEPQIFSRLAREVIVQSHRTLSWLRNFIFGFRKPGLFVGMLGLWPRYFTGGSIFAALRNIQAGHDVPLKPRSTPSPIHEFKIFWNVWKPSTAWRKLGVPKPDFEIVVVDARKTPVPDLYQLSELFLSVEQRPPPPPRKRGPPNAKAAATQQKPQVQSQALVHPTNLIDRIRLALGFKIGQNLPIQKPNPFVHLKAGRKHIIIAAVDGSITHLMRFGEGSFEAWPMM
ncbi:tRNA-splicing endonuclease subunit sen54 [Ceratobasidium sp. AG-Ba]|nr:tRNA-splicing endonuclease subunit sen54 [Ceratobasidium sp. AG-Ba]